MSVDYSQTSIDELEALVLQAGTWLFAADEEGGRTEEAHWDQLIHEALRELLLRGKDGEAVVSRLLDHSNAEIALSAASVALEAQFNIAEAKSALQALTTSRAGNGWPALYAGKILARHS